MIKVTIHWRNPSQPLLRTQIRRAPSSSVGVSLMSQSTFQLLTVSPTANVLPPVDDLSLPLVKLLTHPTYRAYQDHAASLSLIPNTFIKFLPPNWHEPTPPTPAPVGGVKPEDSSEKKEWKRRIKMYSELMPQIVVKGYPLMILCSRPCTRGFR